MAVSGKFLRVGGNPNNPKDWEQCSGNPTCPRHVHIQKAVKDSASAANAIIEAEVEKDIKEYIENHPVTLGEKNRHENGVTVATIFPMLTVALASGGAAVYIADAIAGGPIPLDMAFPIATMFGIMGGLFGAMAGYFTNRKAARNNKAKSLARQYESETGTKLSKQELQMFKNNVSLELTDADHKQNQENERTLQAELNQKFLDEYNSASKNR